MNARIGDVPALEPGLEHPAPTRHAATSGARSRRRGWRLIGACAVAAACTNGCKKGDDGNAYAPPPPPEVIVAAPVQRDVVSYLTFTGVVEPSETVELRARVQGFLERIEFQPGQRVKKGDLLLVIDKRQYQAEVDQAKARIRSQEAALLGAESDARLARDLADQRAGPEIDAVIKSARRDVVNADLEKAKAELAVAELNLDFCEVRAPVDGRITRNYVDVGNLVGRGEPTLLAQIVQATPAFVSIDASEAEVLALRRDMQSAPADGKDKADRSAPGEPRLCELSLSDEVNFKFKGRLDYVEPQMNAETGTLRVRTRYDNTDELLIPGFFTRVRFALSSTNALLVPEAALLSDQQGRYAMVVDDDDEVRAKRVTVGVLDGTMRVVQEGLAADDRIIVLGVLKARPGSKVTPRTQKATEEMR